MLRNPIDRAIMVALKGTDGQGFNPSLACESSTDWDKKGCSMRLQQKWWRKTVYTLKNVFSRNQMTVMLNRGSSEMRVDSVLRFGKYAVALAKRRLCTSTWFGLAEYPTMSKVLFYAAQPLARASREPEASNFDSFDSRIANDNIDPVVKKRSVEVQRAEAHIADIKSESWYSTFRFAEFVQRMNEEDVSVYAFATALFCARATAAGIAETRAAGALRGACDALSETEAQLCGELLSRSRRDIELEAKRRVIINRFF